MRRMMIALAGATALTIASAADAAITIGATGTTPSSVFSITGIDNTGIPETATFRQQTDVGGTFTSYFDFSNDLVGSYTFALITSTRNATITLEQLLGTGGSIVLQQLTGTGSSLTLNTADLAANTTYRFSFTSNYPAGGGTTSGNLSFYAAATPPVPEPATWAMMILGFGGIGMVLRRRRRPVLAQLA